MLSVHLQAVVVGNAVVVVVVDAAQPWEVLGAGRELVDVVGVVSGQTAAVRSHISDVQYVVRAELALDLQVPLLHHAVLVVLLTAIMLVPAGGAGGVEVRIAARRQAVVTRCRAGVAVAVVAAVVMFAVLTVAAGR